MYVSTVVSCVEKIKLLPREYISDNLAQLFPDDIDDVDYLNASSGTNLLDENLPASI